MDHRSTQQFYVVVSPGLETVCAEELRRLGIATDTIDHGGISFAGKLRELYLANLHLRTASRILVRLADFQSRDFPDLYRKARKLPWGRFIRPDRAVTIRTASHKSRLNHTTRIGETLDSAINQVLGRATSPAGTDPQQVMVRIVDDRVTVSIDSSGDLLHRRGYRTTTTAAPLRETLAAGVLLLLGWDGQTDLVDPMCGSGSFVLEGALLARKQAPGLNRSFAFMQWPGYRPGLWALLCGEATRNQGELSVQLSGFDEDPKAIAAAQANCRLSGNIDKVVIKEQALDQLALQTGNGLVVCNPPYGKRLQFEADAEKIYAGYGRHLKRVFPGWRIAFICPDDHFIAATGIPFNRIAKLNNGGLQVGLYEAHEKPF